MFAEVMLLVGGIRYVWGGMFDPDLNGNDAPLFFCGVVLLLGWIR